MSNPQYEVTPFFPLENDTTMFNTIKQDDQIEAVKFNLKMILLTHPGENLSDASFGVGLTRYLFELETSDSGALKQNIMSQIQKYANYFTNLNVIVDTSQLYSNTLTVRIEFEFGIKKLNDYLEVTVSI